MWRTPTADIPRGNAGPNIIVLSYDALRPDHIGHFGYERNITPNLDRFLAESTVWTSAFTPLARTYPSWVALLTGTLPITNQIRDPLPSSEHLVPAVPTLPQALAARGWFTSFRTDDSRFSYMVPEMGFARIEQPPVGIANFAISGSEPRFRAFLGLLDNPVGWALVPIIRENEAFGRSYRNPRFRAGTAQALADASEHDQFFFALHDCTLHAPADRYYPYTLLFGQKDYKGDNRFRYLSLGSVSVGDALPEEEERLAAAQNINLYDAGVVMIDESFAAVRAQLEAGGLWENSIVVLMSDHGEDFYESRQRYRFNGPNHGFHPWGDAQYNVLLAIHWPASMAHRYPTGDISNLVGLIDVAPTLAQAVGMPWSGDGRSLFDGSSRILYMETGISESFYFPEGHRAYSFRSAAASYDVDPTTTRVYARPDLRPEVIQVKDRFVQDEHYKLVWYAMKTGFHAELFDRRTDPGNYRDILAEKPDAARALWPTLAARLRSDGEDVPDDITLALPLPPRTNLRPTR